MISTVIVPQNFAKLVSQELAFLKIDILIILNIVDLYLKTARVMSEMFSDFVPLYIDAKNFASYEAWHHTKRRDLAPPL